MASKYMTAMMALYLTFNLVLLGFTSAQPTSAPVCPLNPTDAGICQNVLGLIPLNTRNVAPCCTVLARLDTPLAAVCACQAVRLNVNVLGINLNVNLTLRVTEILGLCGLPVQTGFLCL
ncbi:hypothetical protein CARUB_v10006590mg [Capsella rubella]|uniref:Hydrophobic seed protein domain-containing protein n=1 Tax=Capsella rubella TaxID=81985 RepID=R0GMK6_9BRAS|nr:putative lipid-binding protein AIR1 [Capsella rubella]EOA18129.1 hypothetical protein CARUB_v10006590mg [Capsella rubella]